MDGIPPVRVTTGLAWLKTSYLESSHQYYCYAHSPVFRMTYAEILIVPGSRISTRLLKAPCCISQLLGLSWPDVALQ